LSWPGLGLEQPTASVQTIDDCVRLVERHLTRPCDLVAQSMGGVVAIRAAVKKGPHVRRIVLCATSGGVDVEALGGADWRREYLAEYPDAGRWITDERADHSHEIKNLTIPTLLLWGDSDPISPIPVGEYLLSLLPEAALGVIEGGTHSFACEQPAVVARLIAEHLSATPDEHVGTS
jgi:pimeloyl-ACP methyl ester carboxylesterase